MLVGLVGSGGREPAEPEGLEPEPPRGSGLVGVWGLVTSSGVEELLTVLGVWASSLSSVLASEASLSSSVTSDMLRFTVAWQMAVFKPWKIQNYYALRNNVRPKY